MRELKAIVDQKVMQIKQLQKEIEILSAALSVLGNNDTDHDDDSINQRIQQASQGKSNGVSKSDNDRVVSRFP
jgi:TolA-binding protein